MTAGRYEWPSLVLVGLFAGFFLGFYPVGSVTALLLTCNPSDPTGDGYILAMCGVVGACCGAVWMHLYMWPRCMENMKED